MFFPILLQRFPINFFPFSKVAADRTNLFPVARSVLLFFVLMTFFLNSTLCMNSNLNFSMIAPKLCLVRYTYDGRSCDKRRRRREKPFALPPILSSQAFTGLLLLVQEDSG